MHGVECHRPCSGGPLCRCKAGTGAVQFGRVAGLAADRRWASLFAHPNGKPDGWVLQRLPWAAKRWAVVFLAEAARGAGARLLSATSGFACLVVVSEGVARADGSRGFEAGLGKRETRGTTGRVDVAKCPQVFRSQDAEALGQTYGRNGAWRCPDVHTGNGACASYYCRCALTIRLPENQPRFFCCLSGSVCTATDTRASAEANLAERALLSRRV